MKTQHVFAATRPGSSSGGPSFVYNIIYHCNMYITSMIYVLLRETCIMSL